MGDHAAAPRLPYSNVQQRLLAKLRAAAHPYGALIGGASAYFADQKAAIAAHIPLALAILLTLTGGFLCLMTVMVTIPKPQHLHVNVRHEDDAFWSNEANGRDLNSSVSALRSLSRSTQASSERCSFPP